MARTSRMRQNYFEHENALEVVMQTSEEEEETTKAPARIVNQAKI